MSQLEAGLLRTRDLCPCLQGYDRTIIPLTVVMILICLGVVAAPLGLLFFAVFPTRYAKPLSYHADVLQQPMR
jgi:hypothetical protein